MTERERSDFLSWVERYKQEIKGNKEKARALLFDAGIITEKGNLRKPYRNLRIPTVSE
jgi:hypothetical protein